MTTLTLLMTTGIILGVLSLEAILLFVLEIPKVKAITTRIKTGIRYWWWKHFNWKDDFVDIEK